MLTELHEIKVGARYIMVIKAPLSRDVVDRLQRQFTDWWETDNPIAVLAVNEDIQVELHRVDDDADHNLG